MSSKNRTVIGVVAAMLLALVGGMLLWQNSDSPESEAVEAPVEETQVLVAKRDIDPGEAASTLADNAYAFVELTSVPMSDVESGALVSVENLEDLAAGRNVTGSVIVAGAQITTADFIVPGQQDLSALPDVDDNLFEVTIVLEPQRAIGGNIRPGMNVAVIASFDEGPAVADDKQTTVTITESTLVTNVQTESLFNNEQLTTDPLAPSLAPTSRLFVTFGVPIEDVERITYAAEFGRIWLARQGNDATIEGSELTVIDNEAVSLDDDAASNGLRIDPFDPTRRLALVDDENTDGDQ